MYGIKDFVTPIAGKYRITSGEGARKARRTTNGAMMSSFHHGTDWAGEHAGSQPDIRNITAGEVVWTGKAGGWGNTVIVRNPDGYMVQYGHLDSINVKVGDRIPAGGKIGVMGKSGNVTGVHLDLIVTKDGKSIKRDGTVLAAAPASIARRAGSKKASSKTATMPEPTRTVLAGDQPQPQPQPQPQQPYNRQALDLFGGDGANVLRGAVGLAIPDTAKENKLFGGIAGMNLDSGLEQIYTEAARAIGAVSDGINSTPVLQSNNPLRAELSTIFDRLEV